MFNSSHKKTLVLGASSNPSRYSFLAIQMLKKNGVPVIALGRKNELADGTVIETEKKHWDGIDTVTLYLNPDHQQEYSSYIISLAPKRVIFNPGTENDTFEKILHENGIETMRACTLVLLSTGQY
ncbi:MAG: CoA-binding protein [Chitinophagaceae bacterium]